jgi:acetyl esterase/lipase
MHVAGFSFAGSERERSVTYRKETRQFRFFDSENGLNSPDQPIKRCYFIIQKTTGTSVMKHHQDNKTIRYVHSDPPGRVVRLIRSGMRFLGIRYRIERDLGKKKVSHRKTHPPKRLLKGFRMENHPIDGHPVWMLHPKSAPTRKKVLFLHGGAYIYGIQSIHWGFARDLSERTNAFLIVPDYPLAPRYTAVEVYEFMDKLYNRMLGTMDSKDLVLLGDSAGGGLALGFVQHLRDRQRPLPSSLILLSPWLDVSLGNPEIASVEHLDAVLTVKGLRRAGRAYAGRWSLIDPRVSPVFGRMDDLPPVSVFVGTHELLYPDCEWLHHRFRESGRSMKYFVYPGLFHDWLLTGNVLKEAVHATTQVQQLIME